jgi:hypothetical protein
LRASGRGIAAASLTTLLLGGCASRYEARVAPTCRTTDTLVLVAQSVSTAERVPCIAALPAGWRFEGFEVRSGHTRFTLDSDRAGPAAVRVELTSRCEVAGATEIASDEPGTRRFEKVESVTEEFRGTRFYVFEGGCVTYAFQFPPQASALVNDISLALSFTTREELARQVGRRSL